MKNQGIMCMLISLKLMSIIVHCSHWYKSPWYWFNVPVCLFPYTDFFKIWIEMPFLHWVFRIVCLLICYVEDLQSIRIVGGLGATIFLPVSFREIYFARVFPYCVYAAPLSLVAMPSNTIFLTFLSVRTWTAHLPGRDVQRLPTSRGQFVYENTVSIKLSNLEAKWLLLMLRILGFWDQISERISAILTYFSESV